MAFQALFLGGTCQLFDDLGAPLAGGKVYFFEPGTSTPKDTYSDSDLSVPNANPVVLDAAGRATIYLSGDYKYRLDTSLDVQVDEQDNINTVGDLSTGLVTPTGATTARTLGDRFAQVFYAKDHGCVADGGFTSTFNADTGQTNISSVVGTDNTSSINTLVSKLRDSLSGASTDLAGNESGGDPVCIVFEPGVYRCSGSLDFTDLRNQFVHIIMLPGAIILSDAAGKISVDFTNTRGLVTKNFTLVCDETNSPSFGVFEGRDTTDGAANTHTWHDPLIVGFATDTLWYNVGAEITKIYNGNLRNDHDDNNALVFSAGRSNFRSASSDFSTITINDVSMSGVSFYGGSIRKPARGKLGILSSISNFRFQDVFMFMNNGNELSAGTNDHFWEVTDNVSSGSDGQNLIITDTNGFESARWGAGVTPDYTIKLSNTNRPFKWLDFNFRGTSQSSSVAAVRFVTSNAGVSGRIKHNSDAQNAFSVQSGTPNLTLETTDVKEDGTTFQSVESWGASLTPFKIVHKNDGATNGPILELFRKSDSPAASDSLGALFFRGNNSAGANQVYSFVRTIIADPTDGSEDGTLDLLVSSSGASISALSLRGGSGSNPVLVRVAGGLKQVTEGAVDSGGSGFKLLRVPN